MHGHKVATHKREKSARAEHLLGDSDDWDVAADEFTDADPPVVSYTEQWAVGRYPITRTRGDNIPGSSDALDDLRSALSLTGQCILTASSRAMNQLEIKVASNQLLRTVAGVSGSCNSERTPATTPEG
jgi:hypothetical protein